MAHGYRCEHKDRLVGSGHRPCSGIGRRPPAGGRHRSTRANHQSSSGWLHPLSLPLRHAAGHDVHPLPGPRVLVHPLRHRWVCRTLCAPRTPLPRCRCRCCRARWHTLLAGLSCHPHPPSTTPGYYSIEGTGLRYDCPDGAYLRVANYALFALFGLAALNEAAITLLGLRGALLLLPLV